MAYFKKGNKDLLQKQLDDIHKKEEKFLNKKGIKFIEDKTTALQEKIEIKIPKKLEETLEKAFAAGFKTVFEKGVGIIEKSYDKDGKNLAYDVNHYAVTKQMNKKNIKRLDQEAKKSMMLNQVVTTIEGGALGAIGIGLPDIPLFIGMILKNIYEVCLSYGFDYTQKKEKVYILYLICASVTKDKLQKNYSRLLNEVENESVSMLEESYRLEVIINEAAHQLADAMLVAKFIQGIPLVGIVGGAYNFTIMKDINQMAQIKYKQRYLRKLKSESGVQD